MRLIRDKKHTMTVLAGKGSRIDSVDETAIAGGEIYSLSGHILMYTDIGLKSRIAPVVVRYKLTFVQ